MEYARNVLPANGVAALALVHALLDHLQKTGALIPKDRQAIIAAASKLVPPGPERINVDARDVISSMT